MMILQLMMRMRMAALGLAGLLFLAGVAELEAQERDTSAARAPAFPKPVKVKATAAKDGPTRAPAASDDAVRAIAPRKTKSAPPPQRRDSLPAIAKPPKTSRPPA